MKTTSVLKPKKAKKEVIFDREALTCEYQQAMFSGLSLVASKLVPLVKNASEPGMLKILVLGTGTGILPMFIRQHFSAYLKMVTTVEIDAGVLIAAKNYFGFNADTDP